MRNWMAYSSRLVVCDGQSIRRYQMTAGEYTLTGDLISHCIVLSWQPKSKTSVPFESQSACWTWNAKLIIEVEVFSLLIQVTPGVHLNAVIEYYRVSKMDKYWTQTHQFMIVKFPISSISYKKWAHIYTSVKHESSLTANREMISTKRKKNMLEFQRAITRSVWQVNNAIE